MIERGPTPVAGRKKRKRGQAGTRSTSESGGTRRRLTMADAVQATKDAAQQHVAALDKHSQRSSDAMTESARIIGDAIVAGNETTVAARAMEGMATAMAAHCRATGSNPGDLAARRALGL